VGVNVELARNVAGLQAGLRVELKRKKHEKWSVMQARSGVERTAARKKAYLNGFGTVAWETVE
jgi:hypothetical protein